MEGMKRKQNHPVFHKSQVYCGPKQMKSFNEVPLLRVFLLPLSVHTRNYTINICSIFFCDYTRCLCDIIMYLEWRYIMNKLYFLRYYVEVGGKRITVVMMWRNKLAPNNLLFFSPSWKYIHQWWCVVKAVYRARANAIFHPITSKCLESRQKKGLPISGGFGCVTLFPWMFKTHYQESYSKQHIFKACSMTGYDMHVHFAIKLEITMLWETRMKDF